MNNQTISRLCTWTLRLGFALSLLSVFLLWTRWAEVFILIAAVVVCPLILSILNERESFSAPFRIATIGQLPAALFLIPAFLMDTGPLAGLLTVPWLIITLLMASSPDYSPMTRQSSLQVHLK